MHDPKTYFSAQEMQQMGCDAREARVAPHPHATQDGARASRAPHAIVCILAGSMKKDMLSFRYICSALGRY